MLGEQAVVNKKGKRSLMRRCTNVAKKWRPQERRQGMVTGLGDMF